MKAIMMFYIRTFWMSIGERLIAVFWPHVVDERIKYKVRLYELNAFFSDLVKKHEEDIEAYAAEYDDLEDRFGKLLYLDYEKFQEEVAKSKPQPQQKPHTKSTKPIKPRVRKAK